MRRGPPILYQVHRQWSDMRRLQRLATRQCCITCASAGIEKSVSKQRRCLFAGQLVAGTFCKPVSHIFCDTVTTAFHVVLLNHGYGA